MSNGKISYDRRHVGRFESGRFGERRTVGSAGGPPLQSPPARAELRAPYFVGIHAPSWENFGFEEKAPLSLGVEPMVSPSP